MLLAVTVFCVWLGWTLRIVRERQAELRTLRADEDYGVITAEAWEQELSRLPGSAQGLPKVVRVGWVRQLLGDEAIQQIHYPSHELSDADVRRLKDLFSEAHAIEPFAVDWAPLPAP
jgi:hypothetical protein